MKTLLRSVSWLMLFSAGLACAATPTTIRASYDISKAGITLGKIEETYQRVADRYTLTSTTHAVGIFSLFKRGKIIVTSKGAIDDYGFRPLSISAIHDDDAKAGRSAELDWNAGKLTLIQSDKRDIIDLPARTQDRLSAMYQFMFLPLKEPNLKFTMINGNYLLNFDFLISPGPVLKTPAGEFTTLYLDNKHQGLKERTEIWLATGSYNLPCKMIVTDPGGGKITQTLSKLEIIP
jgi:hypothetical protein